MRRFACVFALALAAMLAAGGRAEASPYSFSIPDAKLDVFINPDASATLHYAITFANDGEPIDIVDVGLPHKGYDIGNMHAWVDGKPVDDIAPSSDVAVGVVVRLGADEIDTGKTATFRFEATIPDMVYQDTTRDDYASFRITPTWFNSSLLEGTSHLQIAVHAPEGVKPTELLHQGVPFAHRALFKGRAVAIWDVQHRMDGPYMVGLSFPKRSMQRVLVLTRWDLLDKWWSSASGVRLLVGLVLSILFTLAFFRFSGKTGWSVYVVLLVGVNLLFAFEPTVQLVLSPIFLVLLGIMEWWVRRDTKKYFPPLLSVEGGGIKRGLTAPEAAVLLEMPLGKVLTLVFFGMLKKRLVTARSTDPLRLKVAGELATKSRKARRKGAGELGVVIHGYEHPFLDELVELGGRKVDLGGFGAALKALVESTAQRVAGFDIEETRTYYRRLVDRAWTEAEALGEVEVRNRAVSRNLEWLVMDDHYDRRFEALETSRGWRYWPPWFGATVGSGTSVKGAGIAAASVSPAPSASGAASSAAPSFGDVAASFAGWTSHVTGSIAHTLVPGSLSLSDGKGGVLNLSGFDSVTSNVFNALASSGGSGGGGLGGGGCACACAGCACACACAGGGV